MEEQLGKAAFEGYWRVVKSNHTKIEWDELTKDEQQAWITAAASVLGFYSVNN